MNTINPRYYVMSVEFSISAQAENRTQPRAYDSLNEATARLHEVMKDDMRNENIGWAVCYILDNFGNTIRHEEYVKDHYLDPDPEPEIEPDQEPVVDESVITEPEPEPTPEETETPEEPELVTVTHD